MKNTLFSRCKGWKFWSSLVLLGALLFYAKRFTPLNPYPNSDVVINSVTGKYDEDLELWVSHITGNGDGEDIFINLGDRASEANTVEQDVLFLLSPVLRMHPTTQVFNVHWTMVCCMDGGNSEDFVYNRATGKVLHRSTGSLGGKAYDTTQMWGSGIKDCDIHRLASQRRPYTDFGRGF